MERLKEAKYKIAGALVSSKSGSGDAGGLQRLRNDNDDEGGFSGAGGTYTAPSLTRTSIGLHSVAILFTFLAICTMGGVAGFQGRWVGVSGGTGFVLFLLLLDFLLLTALLSIPLIYDRWDRGRRAAQFLNQARSAFILHVFGTLVMGVSCFVVTIAAWTAKGCKNPDDDPHGEDLGDDFKNGLKSWCNTRKASAIIQWFGLGAWIGLLIFSSLAFREDRRNHKEPAFIPPNSGDDLESATPYDPAGGGSGRDDVFADKYEASPLSAQPADDEYARPHAHAEAAPYSYGRPNVLAQQEASAALSRPSMDAYGAFDGDMPGARANEPSHTMQMAVYNDPYADVRAQVMADGGFGHPTPPPQPISPQQQHYPPQQSFGVPAPQAHYPGY